MHSHPKQGGSSTYLPDYKQLKSDEKLKFHATESTLVMGLVTKKTGAMFLCLAIHDHMCMYVCMCEKAQAVTVQSCAA
jgi:hypothetical protein